MHGTFKNKVDVFSIDSLIAWLETQNPEEKYNYESCHMCALSKYFTSQGYTEAEVTPYHISFTSYPFTEAQWRYLPEDWDYIASGFEEDITIFDRGEWTFGKALERAREIQFKLHVQTY